MGIARVVLVSALTALVVIVILAAAGLGVYYFAFRQEPVKVKTGDNGESLTDRIKRAGRSLAVSSTDASKITAIKFNTWSHAGPLYPAANESPGYVSSRSVEFRRDLTANEKLKNDYDRDLPDEVKSRSAKLTVEQFDKLAQLFAEADIINEPNSTQVRSEGDTRLIIEYDGAERTIITSNYGVDTENVKKVLQALDSLKNSLKWIEDNKSSVN